MFSFAFFLKKPLNLGLKLLVKSGLKAILADTPLVRNLKNEQYMEIILNDCRTLEERFSQIDAKIVCEKLKNFRKNGEKMSRQVRNIISQPNLPEKISALFEGTRKN